MIRYDALEALPVRGALPALHDALEGHGTAVLVAPPGTGKTTLVPLALAGLLGEGPARRVVVAEPRRIAARAAARRMAWLLGEKPSGSVGYTVRGERVVGRPGRVEVVTTGVLLQRLQRDQELTGVDVVVLDECHERHLDADTTAAFLWDVRQALRPELRLVAASATTDAEGWARLLGDAPVVEARGASYPVEVVWAPPARPVRPPHGMRVDPALLAHVASVVRRALAERDGDVLCFLPGVGEIARVAGQLTGLGDVDVLQVHGRAPAAVQDAVLAPGTRRRVVLATAVAESSLTVPGVRVVVDAGLAREPRVDHARGLSALTTVRASRAAGRQRAGRAGREAPGTVYRCWAEAEDARLPRFPAPEIEVADLTAFALQAACWGDPDASGLALLDPPPRGAMAAARSVLTAVGAVDGAGRATERGARLARLGVHPRLGRALLDAGGEDRPGSARALLSEAGSGGGAGSGRGAGTGTGRGHGSGTKGTGGHDAAVPGRGARTPGTGDGGGGSATVAEVVALLSEEPPREYGDDLVAALRAARRGTDGYGARWRAEVRRLRAAGRGTGERTKQSAVERTGEGNAGVTGAGTPEEAERGVGERTGQGTERSTGERTGQGTERGTGERNGQGTERNTGERTGQGTERSSGGRNGQGAGAGAVRDVTDDGVAGLVTALAYPERVARKDGGSYLMVSGTRAELPEASALRGAPWIAVAVADRPLGRGHARVRLGAVVDEATARRAAGALLEERDEVHWSGGDVVARRVERLGAVELTARPLTSPDPALVRNALLEGVREEGLGLLHRSAEAEALRQRLAFLRHRLGDPWPDVSDDALYARVDEWLEPELSRARRRADLARIDAAQALARLLPWASGEAARLDELAPERITVPSGSRVRVDYGDPARPVLAVKLQEMFGLQHSPEVAGVPLLVHLLSPAGRPAAVTADLASFWKDGYHGVRAELRGRYPKHPWPEDPATAEPTRHTKARLAK
ncbi:ATP-dependent helicase C-terminal domain-containing protein [Streptomyces rochei]|uniref:ATP-dependent helicase C-terminal domain-containing protein n=1 Tax=Streptomyces rochei TaxID=1928 RepID=UPI002ACDADB6|nr:ATP-dependent helicase C-terminal domain-containing protein [Streptomyces rochei]WQC12263.1 ATP-dependent helicase C-terminal domain-containing protein [Streptomyces rochei]